MEHGSLTREATRTSPYRSSARCQIIGAALVKGTFLHNRENLHLFDSDNETIAALDDTYRRSQSLHHVLTRKDSRSAQNRRLRVQSLQTEDRYASWHGGEH